MPVLAVLALVLAGLAAAPPSWAARPGLDLTYGHDGVATIGLPPPPSPLGSLAVSQFAPAADGSTYVLATRWSCPDTCRETGVLYRVEPDGSLDAGFGGTGAVVLATSEIGYSLAADSRGRALIATIGPGSVVVHRFWADGQPDTSFGTGGAVSLPCECDRAEVEVTPARRERTLIVIQRRSDPTRDGGTARASLFRLLPNGTSDPGFGGDGRVEVGLGTRGLATSIAVARKGAILLGAVDCCSGSRPYVLRVSAAGRLDTRFAAVAGRSLRRLSRLGEFPALSSLVPRPRGGLDLVGSSRPGAGFDLRLRGNGRLARFGRRGLVTLPFAAESAVRGGGGLFAVGSRKRGNGYYAFRVLGNGRLDPRFGAGAGLHVPLTGDGVVATSLGHGRAVVTDLGRHECRYGCPATPGIARFVEGPARR